MHRSRNCALLSRSGYPLLVPLGARPSPTLSRLTLFTRLVLQMPRELHQPELTELPISLWQPRDLLPPARSPLLIYNNPYASLKHYFLACIWLCSAP